MGEWRETDYGKIPVDWELKRVADIKASDKRAIAMGPFGSNIKAENFVTAGVPVIRGTNLNYDKYVDGEFVYLTEEKADELISSNCKAGDLVFTHRGTIGQVGLIPNNKYKRYVVSQSGMKLTVDHNQVDNQFIFYFFKSDFGQFQILKYESQVGVPSISNPLTSLKEIEVPLPPLPEQRAIASVLSSLDDKIDLLQRQNKTLEAMAETLFRQWFVEEAKEEWAATKVKEVCEVITKGTTPTTIGSRFSDTGINFIKAESLADDGSFVNEKFAFIDSETDELLKRSRIQPADVLISIAGTIGRVGLVTQEIIPANTNQAIGIIRADRRKIDPVFLYCLFRTSETRNDFDGRIVHAVQPNLSLGEIGAIEFRMPPKEKLDYGMRQIGGLISRKESNTKQIRILTTLRDTLLPKLMSGEVRVVD